MRIIKKKFILYFSTLIALSAHFSAYCDLAETSLLNQNVITLKNIEKNNKKFYEQQEKKEKDQNDYLNEIQFLNGQLNAYIKILISNGIKNEKKNKEFNTQVVRELADLNISIKNIHAEIKKLELSNKNLDVKPSKVANNETSIKME